MGIVHKSVATEQQPQSIVKLYFPVGVGTVSYMLEYESRCVAGDSPAPA